MKIPTIAFAFSWLLCGLLAAGICRAGNVFLASDGNCLTVADVANALNSVLDFEKDRTADASAQQYEFGGIALSEQIADNKAPFFADASGSRAKTIDHAGKLPGETENSDPSSDSAFYRYLLGITTGIGLGLVLLDAWIVQWRRQRSIQKYWLFPIVQNCDQTVEPSGLFSVQLMGKKHADLPEGKISTRPRDSIARHNRQYIRFLQQVPLLFY